MSIHGKISKPVMIENDQKSETIRKVAHMEGIQSSLHNQKETFFMWKGFLPPQKVTLEHAERFLLPKTETEQERTARLQDLYEQIN